MKPLSAEYKQLFKVFIDHFERELEAINDPTLEKELLQLNTIYQLSETK
jgi:hypothetical protein